MKTDPMKIAQAYELLKAVRDEHEAVGRARTEVAYDRGLAAMAAEAAADAVFNVLNVQANQLDDGESKVVLREVLA